MITYSEYIAFLEDAERIRGELAALASDQQLPRLNEILQQSPRPYRLVMQRILLESYDQMISFVHAVETFSRLRDQDRVITEPPKNLLDRLWRILKQRKWWAALVGLGSLIVTIWASLPDAVKIKILELVFGLDLS